MIVDERVFADCGELARSLASDVAAVLSHAIGSSGKAVLAVSGGSTPKRFLDALSQTDVVWNKVTVTLVDERQVPEDNERSNARLVRQQLLRNKAAQASFSPLYDNPRAAETGPIDAVILGMGNDGHTASFFPGGDRLAEAIDPATKERIIDMRAPGAGEPRLTYTLAALLEADFIALHIEGSAKRDVLAKACRQGSVETMPIRAILQSAKPVTVYWCS